MSKSLLFLGLFLLSIFTGAALSIELVRYGYFILIGGVFLLTYVLYALVVEAKLTTGVQIAGILTGLLLLLFLGIQSPQLPFKVPVIVLSGIVIAIAGVLLRAKR